MKKNRNWDIKYQLWRRLSRNGFFRIKLLGMIYLWWVMSLAAYEDLDLGAYTGYYIQADICLIYAFLLPIPYTIYALKFLREDS